MSLRAMVGILFICLAIIVPWMVSDMLPENNLAEEADNIPFVPGVKKNRREKRRFSEFQVRQTRPVGSSSKRSVQNGEARSVNTGARSVPVPKRDKVLEQSDVSTAAEARNKARISQELQRRGLNLGQPVFVRIFKEENELELWIQPRGSKEYSLFRVYRVCKRSGTLGPKTREGDLQAPEGFYYVTPGRMIAETRYHLGFDIGYPNFYDRAHNRSGSDTLVHGKCVSNSSYALTDGAIEEVYTIAAAAMREGQPYFRVHCFPFRMDDKRMGPQIQRSPGNDSFWANLKEGYDFFEILRFPPEVTMADDGRYAFTLP